MRRPRQQIWLEKMGRHDDDVGRLDAVGEHEVMVARWPGSTTDLIPAYIVQERLYRAGEIIMRKLKVMVVGSILRGELGHR